MPVKPMDVQQLSLYTHTHTCTYHLFRMSASNLVSGVGTVGLAQASTWGYSEIRSVCLVPSLSSPSWFLPHLQWVRYRVASANHSRVVWSFSTRPCISMTFVVKYDVVCCIIPNDKVE